MQTRYWNLQNDTDGVMLREAAALIKQGEALLSLRKRFTGLAPTALTAKRCAKFLKPKAPE